MTARLKLVIFDCDGVMFDSKNANRHYYNHILDHFEKPPMTDEELEFVHTHNVIDSVDHIFRRYPEAAPVAQQYRQTVDYVPYLQYMKMEPDLIDFLEFLKPRHFTAISTNRTTTMGTLLDSFALRPYFQMVVTAFDVENPKPHPEALQKILDHFKLGVEETIFIGDSMIDREHTRSMDMRMIAFRNRNLPAEYHVDSFTEIRTLPLFTGENRKQAI